MKVYLLGILFILVIGCCCYYFLVISSIICSNHEFEAEILKHLCQNITLSPIILPSNIEDLPFSNLCTYICSSHLDVACHPFHLNKPYVFTLTEKHKPHLKFVLKSVTEEYEDEEAYWKEGEAVSRIPTPKELEERIALHIQSFLGRPPDQSLSVIKSSLFQSQVSNLSAHGDLWKLVYDQEFLTSYLFHGFSLFPKIVGVCKTFYALEYAHPLIDNPLLPINIPWHSRIERGIELVYLIKKFETVWLEPIHLCDMKHDHFGWKNGTVLFLDLDCIVTDSSLKNIMTSTPHCYNDEDCSFFDCIGECLPTNQCSGKRRNTNLQVLCTKIFLGRSRSSVVTLYGLLQSDFESSDFLMDTIELCSTNPGMTTEAFIQVLQNEFNSLGNYSPSVEL